MLLTTGVIALSRKLADEKAKKNDKKLQARQHYMGVGSSDVAKRAFESQTARMITPSSADGEEGSSGAATGVQRAGTETLYEDPSQVGTTTAATAQEMGVRSPVEMGVRSPDTATPNTRPWSGTQDSPYGFPADVKSPAKSERALLSPQSASTTTPSTATDPNLWSPGSNRTSDPPPYSPAREQRPLTPTSSSTYSRDTLSVYSRADTATAPLTGSSTTSADAKSLADTQSLVSSRSTNSHGTHAIRVKTHGSTLKSGFPYHPALFDLHVHPDKWVSFTSQIVEGSKFSIGDHAQVWAAATATAMTGAIGTSIAVGRGMTRSVQEKKIKAGLTDMSDGGLGDLLQQWNEEYFRALGLFVHLELSESAMKRPDQKSRMFRKHALLYSSREDRERKRDERKFVIVVTKLDDEGRPTEALQELEAETEGSEALPVEIGSSATAADAGFGKDGKSEYDIPELPGDEGVMPAELPAGVSLGYGWSSEKKLAPPQGFAELESETTQRFENTTLDGNAATRETEEGTPRPLRTQQESYFGAGKEMS